MLNEDERYMHRCLQLAELGRKSVPPNPMVGAVLVHNNKIIGEGYHQKWGEAHAEVVCIESVAPEQKYLIREATLYVSLEPCAHFGKTPPCTNLIIEQKILKVVIGCPDPFVQVDGRGIKILNEAGIDVIVGVLEKECRELNKRFFIRHTQNRPYIILKWAQTGTGKIAAHNRNRLLITNEFTNRIVHKWRSEEEAILVGTNTALFDNPELTTRLWPGTNPVRLVVDTTLRLPTTLNLFDGTVSTIIFNTIKQEEVGSLFYYKLEEGTGLCAQICTVLNRLNLQSLLVEGGAKLLQTFIEEGAWDEARIITNEELMIDEGLSAPVLQNHQLVHSQSFCSDVIRIYKNKQNHVVHSFSYQATFGYPIK